MSKLRSLILSLLVVFTTMFGACDDEEKTEEEVQAGEVVECVVTDEENCMGEPAGEEMPQAGTDVDPDMGPVDSPAGEEMPVDQPAGEEMPTPDPAGEETPVDPPAGEEAPPAGEEMPTAGVEESTEEAPVAGEAMAPEAGESTPG